MQLGTAHPCTPGRACTATVGSTTHPRPCPYTRKRALKQMLQTWGAFLLSFVLRLSSCAVSCPVIYSCQPVPRALPAACSTLELFIRSPSARWRLRGGATNYPRGRGSHSTPCRLRLWMPPGTGCPQTLGARGVFQEGAGFSAQPCFSHWKLGAPPALRGMPE